MAIPMRVLIVDDEELARLRLKTLLNEQGGVELVGEASNGIEAVEMIRELGPDLVILDIQMPGMTGFDVLGELDDPPLVVFATAFDDYAIKAFEVDSIDYLLKPIDDDRFSEAIERARAKLADGPALKGEIERLAKVIRGRGLARLPVTRGKRIVLLDTADIVWAGVENELVFVHTKTDRFRVNMTMSELEKRLDASRFFRTHRSSIVNLDHVVEIVPWFAGKYQVIVDDEDRSELVLSRARVKDLREILPW